MYRARFVTDSGDKIRYQMFGHSVCLLQTRACSLRAFCVSMSSKLIKSKHNSLWRQNYVFNVCELFSECPALSFNRMLLIQCSCSSMALCQSRTVACYTEKQSTIDTVVSRVFCTVLLDLSVGKNDRQTTCYSLQIKSKGNQ